MRSRRRGEGVNLGIGVFLLASELYRTGLGSIPPVTLGFLAFNSAVYMRILRIVRDVTDACVSYRYVWVNKEWRRLLLASFVHLDDMHLYFNMISFLWKGKTLERRYGSRKFFLIIMMFAVLSQILMTMLNRMLAVMLWDGSYLISCAAGFSAVIFALKVLTTHNMWQESVRILGFPITVPAQFACWIELVLIQILVPNASFTGHLAGILVGFAFVYGPLESLINSIDRRIGSLSETSPAAGRNTSYHYRPGVSGYQNGSRRNVERENVDAREEWELQEAIRRSMIESNFSPSSSQGQRNAVHDQPSPPYGWHIPGVYTQEQQVRNRRASGGSMASDGSSQTFQSYHKGNNQRRQDQYVNPPYPTQEYSAMPNYENTETQGRLYPNLQNSESSLNDERGPSAPPLETQELFGVD